MIEFKTGDILQTDAEALVNTVDGELRALGRDLVGVPFAAGFGHGRVVGHVDNRPGAVGRLGRPHRPDGRAQQSHRQIARRGIAHGF